MWEVFEHTADLGLRIQAPSWDELLATAGHGLFSLLVANLDAVEPVQEKTIRVVGEPDQREYQLVDWLGELLFLYDTEQLVLCRFDVRATDRELTAVCFGEVLDPARHERHHEIKAVTYHGLTVWRSGEQWWAEVIVDL